MMKKVTHKEYLALARDWLALWRAAGKPQFCKKFVVYPMVFEPPLFFWIGKKGFCIFYELSKVDQIGIHIQVGEIALIPIILALRHRRYPKEHGLLVLEGIQSPNQLLETIFDLLEETHITAAVACNDAAALAAFPSAQARAALASIEARSLRNQMSARSAKTSSPQPRL